MRDHEQATSTGAAAATADGARAASAVALYTALQDLKRQHPAHYGGRSIATELFRRAWLRLLAGEDTGVVADETAAAALAQILFPGCDEGFWPRTSIPQAEVARLLRASVDESAGAVLSVGQLTALHLACGALVGAYYGGGAGGGGAGVGGAGVRTAVLQTTGLQDLPPALALLCAQPRAGATRPGYQRLVLTPAELHGEHCLLTAVYAYLTAEGYGADRGVAFLAGLAHHLHNALLPDCGFAGEILLGKHLDGVIRDGREQALAQLPTELAERTRAALRHHETIDAPEGRAISAGDVLDRVLDVKWRTRAAAVTDADILGDLDLVHVGPLKDFQTELLSRHGLWDLQ